MSASKGYNMSDQSAKKQYYKKLHTSFKDIYRKLAIEQYLPNVISDLLKIEFFYKTLKSQKSMTDEILKSIKNRSADKELLLKTRELFKPIIEGMITKLENLLENDVSHDVGHDMPFSPPTSLNEMTSSVISSHSDNEKLSSNEIYQSYFSKSAQNQIIEFLYTGHNPPVIKRFLTVCFIDLVGFSTMSEHIEATKVVDILNSFFNQVTQTIYKHHGDIDKFIGDAMLIIFNSAEDAVRCSIDILLKDLDTINANLEFMEIPEIKVHIGLNTGWVVQGNIGSNLRRETTVIGDGVNIAARVQGLSPPNELWMTAHTVSSLGKLKWSMEPVGRKKLKGRSQEVMIYKHTRKIPLNYNVILFEPDKQMHALVKKEMREKGIKNIISVRSYEDFQTQVFDESVKAIAIGPSVQANAIQEVIQRAEQYLKKKLPIIPIIKKKMDKDSYTLYQKLGLKIVAPLYKDEGMNKVSNVVITEKVKDIPKAKKEPSADEVDNIVKEDSIFSDTSDKLDFGAEGEKEPSQADAEETVEATLKRKVNIKVENEGIRLIFNEMLMGEEYKVLREDLFNLWQYSFHKHHIQLHVDLNIFAEEFLDQALIEDVLDSFNFLDEPAKSKVTLYVQSNVNLTFWDQLKSSYKYDLELSLF